MTATATEIKNNFGRYLERAQREPVTVERSGRPHAVILSYEDYERLQALEDRYWLERAQEGKKSGLLSTEETMAAINKRLAEIELENAD